MPAQPVELWAFYLSAAVVAALLVVAVGAAVIVGQRKVTRTTRDYAARQVAALEEERSRVARELHDDVSQQIAILSQRLDAMEEAGAVGGPGALAAAGEVGDGLRDLAATVRALAHRMHPSALDHLGLGPALTSLARETALGTDLQIRLDVALERELEPGPALALYRVAQEALHNVRKHARASKVVVRLADTGPGVSLEISDDGVGFVPRTAAQSGTLGVTSMRERLRLVGGELGITSAPGMGTGIRAWVPRGNGAGR